jgi:putative transposase
MDNTSEPQVNQELLDALLRLMEPCDKVTYGQRLRETAERLGKSVRTVQRWMQRWQNDGLDGFVSTHRADKGQFRLAKEWQEFILKTFQQGNRGGKKMTPQQVYVQVKLKAQQAQLKPPSRASVYRFLAPVYEAKKVKNSISQGGRGERLALKTRDGKELLIEYSNQVWQCDHTQVDVLLVDSEGKLLGRPWLTTIIDSYSRCIMGFHLGFDAPSSTVVALALRHAILPKCYGHGYGLHCEWGTFGRPQYLYTDGGKDFRSQHLEHIGVQLGFTCYLRRQPSDGGLVERPFKTLNTQLFSTLPGYTGSNVQERPKEAEKEATLMLTDLERLLVRYVVDNYNQSLDARMGDQTRYQRWESGLPAVPDLPTERELDVCLMKSTQRRVQRGGCIQFENFIYKGERLSGYEGTQVSLRYQPTDITTVWVYRLEQGKEVFVTQAHAQGLEGAKISLYEAKAAQQRLREQQKSLSNAAILAEVERRQQEVVNTKKARRKQAQADIGGTWDEPQPTITADELAPENPIEIPPVKVWNLDGEI